MSKELYAIGYSAGSHVAEICRKQVEEAKKKKALVDLVGRRLDYVLKSKPDPDDRYTHSPSWSVGFFDGMYDKAQEL